MLWLIGIPAIYFGIGTVSATVVGRLMDMTWNERIAMVFMWPYVLWGTHHDIPSM